MPIGPTPYDTLEHDLTELLALPRTEQVAAALALNRTLPTDVDEFWNSTFGPGSLFDAWTHTSICQSVHQAVADEVQAVVQRPGFIVIDVGGGDGRIWERALQPGATGVIYVVDPVPEAIERVRARVPDGVEVRGRHGFVQDVELPDADAIVISLTLHHVAGRDRAERERHGLEGPGKQEVLEALGRSIAQRDGFIVLVEADIHCELDLPSGDPVLRDNLFDSYVRRCTVSILEDIAATTDPVRRHAWRGLLRHWFLGQIAMADVPLAERDVYELRVAQWLSVIRKAGLTTSVPRCVDDRDLFHLYRLQMRSRRIEGHR